MQSDIVWWSDEQKELWLFKLMTSFELFVADTCLMKM